MRVDLLREGWLALLSERWFPTAHYVPLQVQNCLDGRIPNAMVGTGGIRLHAGQVRGLTSMNGLGTTCDPAAEY